MSLATSEIAPIPLDNQTILNPWPSLETTRPSWNTIFNRCGSRVTNLLRGRIQLQRQFTSIGITVPTRLQHGIGIRKSVRSLSSVRIILPAANSRFRSIRSGWSVRSKGVSAIISTGIIFDSISSWPPNEVIQRGVALILIPLVNFTDVCHWMNRFHTQSSFLIKESLEPSVTKRHVPRTYNLSYVHVAAMQLKIRVTWHYVRLMLWEPKPSHSLVLLSSSVIITQCSLS